MSGATKYQELCVAAKNEEKRLAELKRRQHYRKTTQASFPKTTQASFPKTTPQSTDKTQTESMGTAKRPVSVTKPSNPEPRKCFLCNRTGHLMRDCKKFKDGNSGSNRTATTKQDC